MKKKIFSNFIKGSLTVIISVLVIYGVVQAGTITPPSGTPSAQFYTLSEIYNFITNNTAATEGGHSFTFSDSLAGTGRTLTEIYNALASLISADQVKLDTTYLGVKGTLAPDGTAEATDCLDTKTFYSGNSWTRKTGSIVSCSSEGSQSCYATGTYYAGTLKTLSADSETVNAGYYAATTLSGVDSDLAAGNIKKDITIFGKTGTLAPDGTAEATDCLDTKTFYSGNSWTRKTGSIVSCSVEGGNACYAASGYWTATDREGDNTSTAQAANGGVNYFTAPAGFYDGDDRVSATDAEIAALDADIVGDKIKDGEFIFGVEGTYTGATSTYTWTKAGAGSWVGVNENLDWVKEIGAAGWWSSITYTYCAGATTCTTTSDNATLKSSASYTGPPGGWNGSNNSTNFNQTALQAYAVVTADSTNLGNCTADKGDLVFPDGSVWDKSAANSYSTTLAGCEPNSGGNTWTNAGGSGKQYGYANNAPSALSIADAWDGIKDLTSGANNIHPYDNDGTMDDYYDIPSTSWYSGGGTSRLPMIDEYERARKGTVGGGTSLLYQTNAWNNSLYLWLAEPYPSNASYARNVNPVYGSASSNSVNNQNNPFWVVVAQ